MTNSKSYTNPIITVVIKAVYEAGCPNDAVWRVSPDFYNQLLKAKYKDGSYLVHIASKDRAIALFGHPVDIVDGIDGIDEFELRPIG